MSVSTSKEDSIREGYVRVTQILSSYQDFSRIDPAVLERKAKIGTEVHEAIEAHYRNDFFPVSEPALDYIHAFNSAVHGAFEVFSPVLDFSNIVVGKVMLMEKRYYSDMMKITGKIDMIGLNRETGKSYLIDYKTTYSANYRMWEMQMALYMLLIQENEEIKLDGAKILHLKKSGAYKIVDLDITPKIFGMAKAAVDIYHHFH